MQYFSIPELGKWFTKYAMQIFPLFKEESFAPGLAVAIMAFVCVRG
jgi:hypothetical protein